MRYVGRCSSDTVTENNSNINFDKWKDDTLYGQSPMKEAQIYIKEKHERVYTEQSQSNYQYIQAMGRVEHNIMTCMISHRSKKWC